MKGTLIKLLASGGLLAALPSFALGYEKAVILSGHYAGIGNAATSSVFGSESIYFNPAGLGFTDKTHAWNVSANFSPTWPRFKEPTVYNDQTTTGSRTFLPILAATASYALKPGLGLGLGVYESGGASAEYDGVTLAAPFASFGAQTVKSSIKIIEVAVGAGYEVMPRWTIGAAWRVAFVKADFSTFNPVPVGTTAPAVFLSLDGLSDTKFNGFRLGTQYRSEDYKWGAGLSLRTALNFAAKGTSSGTIQSYAGGSAGAITGGDVTVKNSFPLQVALGGDHAIGEHWRVFAEYLWTHYAANQFVEIDGNITLPTNPFLGASSGKTIPLTNIAQNWYNMHTIRLAGEYTGINDWTLRAGYNFVTQAVPKSTASAIFAVPGIGNSISLGAGTTMLATNLCLDAALEYAWASGTVKPGEGLSGDYSVNAYALHLGATYKF